MWVPAHNRTLLWRRPAGGLWELARPYRRSPRALGHTALLALAIAAVVMVAKGLGWLDYPEMKLLDARFQARGAWPDPPADLLIVALDDATMQRVQRLSPVPRTLLAALVRRLSADGARTIVLDVALPDRLPGDEDAGLIDAVFSAGNVVLPAMIDQHGRWAPPHPDFAQVAREVALAYVETNDVDHVARWHKPVIDGGPSLALAAWAHFRAQRLDDILAARTSAERGRRLGQRLDAEGRALIDFVGPPGAMPRVSAADLLDGRIRGDRIRGKLVLVGATWSSARDRHFVPFGDGWLPLSRALMAGVELQANGIAGLLSPLPLRPAGEWLNGILMLTIVLTASLAMVFFPPTTAALLSLVLGGAWIAAEQALFTRAHLVVLAAPPLAGIVTAYLASALLTERRARRLRHHFRRHVGRALADEIAELSDAEIGRLGKTRTVTILFADLRDYTRFSSRRKPEEVVAFLNAYYERTMAVIHQHHGFVVSVMGDGIMVLFGLFGRDVSDVGGARQAARAARAMRDAVEELRRTDARFAEITIGIGIHTGDVVTGEIGTAERTEFAAIGSATNLASRIEGATKPVLASYRERGEQPAAVILLSDATHDLIDGTLPTRPLGPASIRGLEDEDVRLWELL
jgi:class 3 adenylate cyclase